VTCAACAGGPATVPTRPPADAAVADAIVVDASPPPPAPAGYLKGQLHLHTGMSGDSNTPPDQVVRWYAEHGYDFIVVTDHNHVTELPPRAGDMLVIPGVELTHSTSACDPPPEKKKCLVHVNALFVDTPAPLELPVAAVTSVKRLALYLRFVDAARALGGVPMLNHPNFAWTADAALVAEVGRHGVPLVEFANQGMTVSNPGDATHESSEALWDSVLSAGVRMWGVASDDAHHYYDVPDLRAAAVGRDGGPTIYPGDLGWVMVHAEREPKAIRAALERGDFYASTGVTFAEVALEPAAIVVDVAGVGPFHIECVGAHGQVLEQQDGVHARCVRPPGSAYVRVRVTDSAGRHAWTQPLF
jgi:hypothetical protein